MPWYRAEILTFTDTDEEAAVEEDLRNLIDFEGFYVRHLTVFEVPDPDGG